MTIMNDKWIRENGVLDPCYEFTNHDMHANKIISKGISSYGYDLTCANEFKIFTNRQIKQRAGSSYQYYSNSKEVIDPKNFNESNYVIHTGNHCVIPPNSFALTRSVEYFRMPRNIIGICLGKSTYARCGIVANTTLIEPEWEGHLTIELSNTSPLPVKVYANEGIVQVVFMEANDLCEISYADRKGKYQGQQGITGAKL